MVSVNGERPAAWKVWLLAARPKTLPAGIVPVVVGGAIAYGNGGFHPWAFLAAMFGSIMIQIGANYSNDLFDYLKRTDTSERIGPLRVTQAGWVTPKQTARAAIIVFSLAAAAGIYLVCRGGWPIVIIGLASITCAILYTAGPAALGYIGVADIFVLIFFGPVALAGAYYVQTLHMSWLVVAAGIPFGMISTALLTVNNLRDIESDKKGDKKTLAVRYGRTFARMEYLVMLVGAAAMTSGMVVFGGKRPFLLLAIAFLLPAVPVIKDVFTTTDGEKLNDALAATGRLLIIYGLFFSAGWLM